jgi:L,D-transpeptidase YcbB
MICIQKFVVALFASVFLISTSVFAAPPPEQVSAAISQILSSGQKLPLPLERVKATLQAHYVKNRAGVYWIGTGRAAPFLQRMNNAMNDGLTPTDYPTQSLQALAQQGEQGDVNAAAQAELYLSAYLITYTSDIKTGRVAPQKVDPSLFRPRKTIDSLRVLKDLQNQANPSKYISGYEPRNSHYQTLKKMLKVYSTVLDQGISWPRIADGPPIKPGQSDPRIVNVRALLSITGDFEWTNTNSPVYDERLAIAVRRFQVRHGLEAKGLIGKQSIMALNVSPAERQKQIIINMERWRWMPDALGADHFLVNIAGFELQRIEANTIVDRMDVVVGAVATQTPEFSASMQYVELNPTWTVPYSIATKEMLPKLRSNPYAYAEDFDLFAKGRLADWGSVNWSSYGAGSFPFTFRQRPGPKNALGKVKFMLPNSHNIYLHDTPSKDKFANTTRAFSHGCIRLSRPGDLAYSLLGDKTGMSSLEIDAIWAGGETTKVTLPQQIPVHLVYATAFATENGIEFRPDVYGRDRKLYAALFGRAVGS